MEARKDIREIFVAKSVHVTPAESMGGSDDGTQAIIMNVTNFLGETTEVAMILQHAVKVHHAMGLAIDHCYDMLTDDGRREIDRIDEEFNARCMEGGGDSTDDDDCE